MVHPRRHEQTKGVLRIVGSTHRGDHAVVIVDGIVRGDSRVVPAVIQEELSLVRDKFFQIRISCRDEFVLSNLSASAASLSKFSERKSQFGFLNTRYLK
jgi:hypothetical protein